MKTASDIVAALGEDAVAAAFGITVKQVRKRVREGLLPTLWFAALERMAGQPLPRQAFSFKVAAE